METKRKPNGYWTLERCMEDASKHGTKAGWRNSDGGGYDAARRKGWLDQCSKHMLSTAESKRAAHLVWTLDKCLEDAARFKSPAEWSRQSGGAYSSAQRNGWLDKCQAHMEPSYKPNGYWTLERCIEEAEKYETKADWARGNISSHSIALRNGWMDECASHMFLGFGATKNNVVYMWRDAETNLHKVGITSEQLGESRIGICRRNNNMDPRIVFMLKVADARAVEAELLKLGTDPELDSSIDGYTEFRVLTNEELGKAVSTAYQYAVAA